MNVSVHQILDHRRALEVRAWLALVQSVLRDGDRAAARLLSELLDHGVAHLTPTHEAARIRMAGVTAQASLTALPPQLLDAWRQAALVRLSIGPCA